MQHDIIKRSVGCDVTLSQLHYHFTVASKQEMHAKQELEALKISKQEYSTNISEAQEYSNEKKRSVSLSHKRMLGSNQAYCRKEKQTN